MRNLVFKTNPLVSVLSTFLTNLSFTVFLATAFFTASLSSLKSKGTGNKFSISDLSASVFKLAKKLRQTFSKLFNLKLEISTCEIFLISGLLHN